MFAERSTTLSPFSALIGMNVASANSSPFDQLLKSATIAS